MSEINTRVRIGTANVPTTESTGTLAASTATDMQGPIFPQPYHDPEGGLPGGLPLGHGPFVKKHPFHTMQLQANTILPTDEE